MEKLLSGVAAVTMLACLCLIVWCWMIDKTVNAACLSLMDSCWLIDKTVNATMLLAWIWWIPAEWLIKQRMLYAWV